MNLSINSSYNPRIENPDIAAEIKADNLSFKEEQRNATKEWTNEMKKWVLAALYWDIKKSAENISEEKKNENTEKETNGDKETNTTESEQEILEKKEKIKEITESKEYPLIKSVLEKNNINVDTKFFENSTEDWKINIEKLDIENSLKEEISELLDWLKEENKEENISNFSKRVEESDIFKSYDTKLEDWKFQSSVLNVIWSHYIEVPKNSLNENIELSINSAKNSILSDFKNINRNTKTFEISIEKIESWSIEDMISWLETLNNLAVSTSWKFSKKKLDWIKKREKSKIKKEAILVNNELEIAKTNNNYEKIKKLEKEKQSLIQRAEELTSWDIFEAGEIDKISEKLPEQKEDNI